MNKILTITWLVYIVRSGLAESLVETGNFFLTGLLIN